MIILSIWIAIFHKNIYKLPNYFSIKWTEKLFTFKGNISNWKEMVSGIENYKCCLHMSISWIQQTPSAFLQGFFKEYTKRFRSFFEKTWDLSFNKTWFSDKDRNTVFHSDLKAHELTAALCRNKRLHRTFLCALLDDTSENKWDNSLGESQS